jgi:hypothetical protein
MEEAIERAKKTGKFDYDAPLPGIEVLDRYTLRIRLSKPDYNFLYILAMCNVGAQAREVVEAYGADIGSHPWARALPPRGVEAQLQDRARAEPELPRGVLRGRAPGRRSGLAAALQGEQGQAPADRGPRRGLDHRGVAAALARVPQHELDWINLPYEFLNMALPGGKLAPTLRDDGVRYIPDIEVVTVYMYFNMKDPLVGGYTPRSGAAPRHVARLQQRGERDLIRNGTAIEAQSPAAAGRARLRPHFNLGKSYDPPKAKALLDMFGYVDRDGDGWRDMPDGSRSLRLRHRARRSSPLFTAVVEEGAGRRRHPHGGGRRQVARPPQEVQGGKLQTWELAWGADYPDGENYYQLLYGPTAAPPTTAASSCPSSTGSTTRPRRSRRARAHRDLPEAWSG